MSRARMSLALALLMAIGVGGCSSVFDLAGGTREGPRVYGGLRSFGESYEWVGIETRDRKSTRLNSSH